MKHVSVEMTGYSENLTNDIIRRINKFPPNVYLATKEDTENPTEFPFNQKVYGINRITLMNYAGTVFISGVNIASRYPDEYRKWFSENLINGTIEANVILTNPRSQAARDAAQYKMFPKGQKIKSDQIIINNINTLLEWKEKNPKANINIWLTDIALPYGIMLAETDKDPNMNYMKVDIYSGVPANDDNRPSFYLYKDNLMTEKIYTLLKGNLTVNNSVVEIHLNYNEIAKYRNT